MRKTVVNLSFSHKIKRRHLVINFCLLVLTLLPQSYASTNVLSNQCLSLMPCPKELTLGQGLNALPSIPTIYIKGMSELRQQSTLKRFNDQLNQFTSLNFTQLKLINNVNNADIKVIVQEKASGIKHDELPTLDNDESYQLAVSTNKISILANSDFGALHGLTTLVQLITLPNNLVKQNININTSVPMLVPVVKIDDKPRFKWRGLLIDSVRHFIPINTLKRQLDGMAAAKLNVFHWHLTDDQGWRIESKYYPKLQQLASDNLFYTQNEIKDLVKYASLLGIRVVPEFDLPGHASAIAVAYPELITDQKEYAMQRHWGIFEPLLDVSNTEVYRFIEQLVIELKTLFPDDYLHIGGDEVNPKQWQESKNIKKLMLQQNLKDGHDVQSYFNQKLHKTLTKHNRKMMGWDEIFINEADIPKSSIPKEKSKQLPKNVMVQSWRGLESLNSIAAAGYNGLLSTGYYIDQPQRTSFHYDNDPLANVLKNTTAPPLYSANSIQQEKNDNWLTWSLTIPRLKGSAVQGKLVLVSKANDQGQSSLSGYLKLNKNNFTPISLQTSLAELQQHQLIFTLDSWMGPLRFELDLHDPLNLKGKVFIGNALYAIEGEKDTSQAITNIELLSPLTMQQAENILGGEATLWTEMVDKHNIDLRTWPRLFAIAERFWSAKTIKDTDNMYQRLMLVDNYAANVIGLTHQLQQRAGLIALFTPLDNQHIDIDSWLVLAQAYEPAHYYTRHHLKFQQNNYHQQAALNYFVDYLPVESFTLLMLSNQLNAYVLGDESALIAIKTTLSIWQNNLNKIMPNFQKQMSSLSHVDDTLKDVSLLLNDMNKFIPLAITIADDCNNTKKLTLLQREQIEEELSTIQKKQTETVLAALPIFQELSKHCSKVK